MSSRLCPLSSFAALAFVSTVVATAKPHHHGPPPDGEYVRHAHTGHVSNYDEARVGHAELPDPLVLADGTPVRDAATWMNRRRPEILALYERDVYGRVPATAPRAHVEVVASGEPVLAGAGVAQHIILRFGPEKDGPFANVMMYLPAHAGHRVPVLLQETFSSGLAGGLPEQVTRGNTPDLGPVAEILRRGYAYATFRYTDVQPDDRSSPQHGVEALSLPAGQTRLAPDEWGSISAWAWAASRVLDFLETDPAVDAHRVAIIGHSRLGKTALWAAARDPRFALVFASCPGEMGASLSRRDYGETIDDVTENFPWWFAGNFQKYRGNWNALPVDAHMLIALSAPRPVFITGGTGDQWSDPKGEFLAEVAASRVYRLLGAQGIGTTDFPPVGTPLISGDLGWNYHRGPHAILPEDWQAFLDFADQHLKPAAATERPAG